MTESFPRQQARTRRFSLGVPRSFQVAPDGRRVVFLRSQGGADPVTCLWQLHVDPGHEELLADPAGLEPAGEDLSPQEKARRERTREQAGGIVGFATDLAMSVAVFTLAGRVYVASLPSTGAAEPGEPPEPGEPAIRELGARSPALDPRPDPTGTRVAYVCDGALRVIGTDGRGDTALADPAGTPGLSYGLAEFIAAEEMGRMRGYWWAPDGASLLVARVDETPVQRWHIADPANPGRPPAAVAYPAAGTPNAAVSLLLAGLDGRLVEVDTGGAAFPYLVTVSWDTGDPLIVVLSRDQRVMRLLAADPATGATTVLREDTDPRWLDIVPGVPARTGGPAGEGRIVWVADADGTRRLLVAAPGELASGAQAAVTPPGLQVREVLSVDAGSVLFTASADDPAAIGLWLYRPRAGQEAGGAGESSGLEEISPPGGVHAGTRSGGTTVITSRTLAQPGPAVLVRTESPSGGGTGRTATGPTTTGPTTTGPMTEIAVLAETPNVPVPHPDLFAAGSREIPSAVLFPSWHQPGSARLPVLLDPYGGPHAQRVLAAQGAFLTSQWLAEQGFAVLVADGRGTPGRGPEWEREVWHDLAGPVLDDQVEALTGGRRAAPRPGYRPGRDPRLVVRRLPGRAGGAAPPGRVPRGGGGRAGHRLAAVRHLLHRALPRSPRRSAAGVRADFAAGRRAPADPPAAVHPRAGRRQRGGRAHAADVLRAAGRGAAAQRAPAVRGDAHDTAGGSGREPALAAGGLPPPGPGDERNG